MFFAERRKKKKEKEIYFLPAEISFELRRFASLLYAYAGQYPEKKEAVEQFCIKLRTLSYEADVIMNGGNGDGIRVDGV